LDATTMPIRSGSVDAITSLGGLSNVANQAGVLREMARILKPGGRVYMVEATPESDVFNLLPQEVIQQYSVAYAAISQGFDRLLNRNGFKIMESERTESREMSPDESGLAKVASEHGVTLSLSFYRITATVN